jgi:hypothetical protein
MNTVRKLITFLDRSWSSNKVPTKIIESAWECIYRVKIDVLKGI